MQTYIVHKKEGEIFSYLLGDDDRTIEIHREKDAVGLRTGDILIGRVQSVAWNIQAAFIDVGQERCCYLALDELKHPLYTKKGASTRIQQGDELLLQVIREPIKTKAAALSAGLTMRGRFLLLTTGNLQASASRKLSPQRRSELKALAEELATEQFGVLMRTNAETATNEQIRAEYTALAAQLGSIREKAMHRLSGSVLAESGAGWMRRLLDLQQESIGRIVLEDEALYERAAQFLQANRPELLERLVRHDASFWPIDKQYSLDERLKRALQEKVWLRSGAYLIIQATEALTAIDVNTGNIGPGKLKHNREDTFLKVNLEAAKEIAVQLRLRGISGMILVDFINMTKEENNRALMAQFAGYLARDPQPASVIDMTGLGLVEVTRKKGEAPLAQQSANA